MVIRQSETMDGLTCPCSAQDQPGQGADDQSFFNRYKRAFHDLQKSVGGKARIGYLSGAGLSCLG